MGRSSVTELINKGKAENAYNNSGIKTPAQWMDHFNSALDDLVDDLDLTDAVSIVHNGTTRENDLPTDFYGLLEFYDASGIPIRERRSYGSPASIFPCGYWILNKGKYVIDLYRYDSAQTFTGLYQRYAAKLTDLGQFPEVPTVGEMALPYYALGKALRNNNQVGQAVEMEKKYEAERLKIRTAAARARR